MQDQFEVPERQELPRPITGNNYHPSEGSVGGMYIWESVYGVLF